MSFQSNIPTNVLNEYKSYGVEEILIIQAWQHCKGDKSKLFDAIEQVRLENQSALSQIQSQQNQGVSQQDQDMQMDKAIMESLQEAKQNPDFTSFEPLNPEQRIRSDKIPVGLKNIGNTCYFNSLLFVKQILNYQDPQIKEVEGQDKIAFKRQQAGVKLVLALQKLFALMIGSDKKYLDPSEVLKSIVDDQGTVLPIGEQKDIGEFLICFLSTLDEGLKMAQYKQGGPHQGKMEIEGESIQENLSFQETESLMQSHGSPSKNSLIRSQSLIKEDSVINELFFGKAQVKMTYPLGDQIQHNVKDELFNIIFLDIQFKNMYQAWDEFIINEIDDYKNDKGDIVKAQKEYWIKKQPSTLFFQLKRVYYDVEAQMVKKSNAPFNFEQEICIDRFMLQNNEEYMRVRSQVKEYQKQYDLLESQINQIQQFNKQEQNNNKGLDLDNVLETAGIFLQNQVNSNNDNSNTDATYFGCNNPKLAEQVLQFMKQYQLEIQDRVSNLKKQMEQIQNTIEQSYNMFKIHKYKLQSILIHDGQGAESGHYYSFIKDFQDGSWRRYNDQNIKITTEEEVLKESIGGSGNASAYCLVYVSDAQIQKEQSASIQYPMRSYRTSQQNTETDLYRQLLPPQILIDMEADNDKFQKEIEDYRISTSIKKIVDSYLSKFELINSLNRKSEEFRKTTKNSPLPMINYCVYLKSIPNIDNIADIVKFQILDTCVREFHPNQQALTDISQDSQYFKKLQTSIKALGNFKESPLKLQSKDQDLLDQKIADYLTSIQNAVCAVFFMNKVIEKKFQGAFSSLDHLLQVTTSRQQPNAPRDYFLRIAQDSRTIVIVECMRHIDHVIQNNRLSDNNQLWLEMYNNLQNMVAFHNKYMADDKFRTNLKVWLTDMATDIQDQLKAQQIEQLKDILHNKQPYNEGIKLLEESQKELDEALEKSNIDSDPYNWNMNKQEDVYLNEVVTGFNKYKDCVINSIQLNKQFESNIIPLAKNDRNAIIQQNK